MNVLHELLGICWFVLYIFPSFKVVRVQVELLLVDRVHNQGEGVCSCYIFNKLLEIVARAFLTEICISKRGCCALCMLLHAHHRTTNAHTRSNRRSRENVWNSYTRLLPFFSRSLPRISNYVYPPALYTINIIQLFIIIIYAKHNL